MQVILEKQSHNWLGDTVATLRGTRGHLKITQAVFPSAFASLREITHLTQ